MRWERGKNTCPQPQRSQLSTGEIAPFRLNSAQMRFPPQAVICASSTGGCPRFALPGRVALPGSAASIVASPLHGDLLVSADLTACCGYCITCSSSSIPQLRQERKEPFPGRPALLAGLCAKRTAKARQTDRKMNIFIFRLASWLSFARKLAWRASSYRRIPFVFFIQAGSPEWVQGAMHPGAGFRAAEALTFLCPAPVIVSGFFPPALSILFRPRPPGYAGRPPPAGPRPFPRR